jgi:hypothetical protein
MSKTKFYLVIVKVLLRGITVELDQIRALPFRVKFVFFFFINCTFVQKVQMRHSWSLIRFTPDVGVVERNEHFATNKLVFV